MSKQEKQQFIFEHISEDQLCESMLGNFGWSFCLYIDGKTGLEQKGSYAIDPKDRPIASTDCVGLGNIDTTFWTDGWTTYDPETREYIVNETQERIDLEEAIRRCCDEGDILSELEELRQSLLEDWERNEENGWEYYARR